MKLARQLELKTQLCVKSLPLLVFEAYNKSSPLQATAEQELEPTQSMLESAPVPWEESFLTCGH